MDLQRAYDRLGEQDKELEIVLPSAKMRDKPSHHPLAKLHRALVWNLVLSAGATLALMGLLLSVRYGVILLLLGVVLGFCVWATVDAIRLLRDWRRDVSTTNSLLVEMQRQHDAITRWMRAQMRVALFVYPFAAAGGFLLGGVVGAGKDVAGVMEVPGMWTLLGISLLVMVPLCYLLAKWMFKISFGKHLVGLRQRIDELTR